MLLPVIKLLPVATKRQTQQVQIIDAPDFFGLLKKLQVVKTPAVKKNLCKFLCIDEAYIESLMFKKIVKALKDIEGSKSLSFIGTRKKKSEATEEEYYDEEEEEVKLPLAQTKQ